jgi:2-methylcitrate dehydratase PrpD
MSVPGLTSEVSAFVAGVSLDSVPLEVTAAAKRSVLDGLGLAVAGSRSQPSRVCREQIASYLCTAGEAAALGTSLRIPARFAAFLNGLAIHADDYDDTQLAVRSDRVYGLLTHPTAPVLPAALAVTQRRDGSGADLLTGYLVGVEVGTKVAEAIAPRHYEDGFHSTGTAGAIGAAAAAARLLGLDPAHVATALGIGASTAAGLRENFGTMTKPLHAGRAAESGVLAADLAAAGFSATGDILEARRGFFAAAGGGFDPDSISGVLGSPWTFASPGISIKPHPSGSLTHPAMTALADLLEGRTVRPDDVESITVGTNRHMPNALIHHRPADHLAAKFSMEFCMAILVIEGRAGLAQFTDAVVRRPDVQDLMKRVELTVDPDAEAAGYNSMTSIVRLRLRTGEVLAASRAFATGSPSLPMSDDELITKFTDCLQVGGISEAAARAVADQVLQLENLDSIQPIVSALAPAG